jgi:D-glycero-alpha-D-manno-heptose 1-phosphate guanylyltransferase
LEAIVLAGGLGTRLRNLVPDMPKPMAPVRGRPFLEIVMDYWIEKGVRRFVLSVGYKHECIQQHFGAGYRGAEMNYAVEKTPLGTGGGLLHALGRIRSSGSFLVLNGDTFFAVDLMRMKDFHREKGSHLTFALRPAEDPGRYDGIRVDRTGRLREFLAREHVSSDDLMNGGVYLARREAFAGLGSPRPAPISLEDDLFPAMLGAGRRMFGFVSTGRFIDIGVPEDYALAASMLAG